MWLFIHAGIKLNHVIKRGPRPSKQAHKNGPYLPLTGELWGMFSELFVENWLSYIH